MSIPLSGATRLAAVIGHPVIHSLSPAIHNAAFAATGLDWVFVAFDVAVGDVRGALEGTRALGIAGLSVTMPHKAAVAELVDELTPAAASLGAVNCVVNRHGHLLGDNTDGAGFLRGLADDSGHSVSGRRCLVVGAGGAARAVVLACAEAGAEEVVVLNRNRQRGEAAAELAGERGRIGEPGDVARAEMVVNATPIGMGDDQRLPLDPSALSPGQVVVDLVYHPAETPLLRAARRRGLGAHNGLSMLVHQAAVAFERWTGTTAPVEAMRDAVSRRLGG